MHTRVLGGAMHSHTCAAMQHACTYMCQGMPSMHTHVPRDSMPAHVYQRAPGVHTAGLSSSSTHSHTQQPSRGDACQHAHTCADAHACADPCTGSITPPHSSTATRHGAMDPRQTPAPRSLPQFPHPRRGWVLPRDESPPGLIIHFSSSHAAGVTRPAQHGACARGLGDLGLSLAGARFPRGHG